MKPERIAELREMVVVKRHSAFHPQPIVGCSVCAEYKTGPDDLIALLDAADRANRLEEALRELLGSDGDGWVMENDFGLRFECRHCEGDLKSFRDVCVNPGCPASKARQALAEGENDG